MKIHCCRNRSSDGYQIKQRYNPTFVHQPIFQSSNSVQKQPRFSKTFYSTALDTEGYNIKTLHEKHQKIQAQSPAGMKSNSVYWNYSHERRLEDLYPKTGIRYSSKDKWYDHTKENYLSCVRNCNNLDTLRQRKILQLASAPVFTDFDYESRIPNSRLNLIIQPKIIQNPQQQALVHHKPEQQAKCLQKTKNVDEIKFEEKIHKNQSLNKDSNYQIISEKITKKNFHKNCVPQSQASQTVRSNKKMMKSQSVSQVKVVSKNPTFTVVRGNKIDNRL